MTPSQKPQAFARVVHGFSHSNVIQVALPQSVYSKASPPDLTTNFTERVELFLTVNLKTEYANPVRIQTSDDTDRAGWFDFLPHSHILDEPRNEITRPIVCTI